MDVELLIVTHRDPRIRTRLVAFGGTGQALPPPEHTTTRIEDLSEEQVHDLKGRFQALIFQFEQEMRERRRHPPGQ